MQPDGAARALAPTVRAHPAATVAATSVEPLDATRRRAVRAGEAAMVQERTVQVTREVTWRHCMATAQGVQRAAPRLAALLPAARMAAAARPVQVVLAREMASVRTA